MGDGRHGRVLGVVLGKWRHPVFPMWLGAWRHTPSYVCWGLRSHPRQLWGGRESPENLLPEGVGGWEGQQGEQVCPRCALAGRHCGRPPVPDQAGPCLTVVYSSESSWVLLGFRDPTTELRGRESGLGGSEAEGGPVLAGVCRAGWGALPHAAPLARQGGRPAWDSWLDLKSGGVSVPKMEPLVVRGRSDILWKITVLTLDRGGSPSAPPCSWFGRPVSFTSPRSPDTWQGGLGSGLEGVELPASS